MSIVEIKVPDIGGHENVDIIAVEVKAGDTIAVDDTLITLETDKATMDVPADAAGVVKEVKVKVGDKVSEGGVILLVETAAAADAPAAPVAEALPPPRLLRPLPPLPLRAEWKPSPSPTSAAMKTWTSSPSKSKWVIPLPWTTR